MPEFGVLDTHTRADSLPEVTSLAERGWESKIEQVHFVFELDDTHRLELIPKALHPTIPVYGGVVVRRHLTSPIGEFTVAELRIVARAGVHQAGLVTRTVATTEEAVELLRGRYGCPAVLGKARVEKRHVGRIGRVELDGALIFDGVLERPEPISPDDVLFPASLHLALVEGEPQLVRTSYAFTADLADRGTARVRCFDAAGFGESRVVFTNPLPAVYVQGRVEIQPIKWLIDPEKPAITGSKRVLTIEDQ